MKSFLVYICCVFMLVSSGCTGVHEPMTPQSKEQAKENASSNVTQAVAVISPISGSQVKGVVHLSETADGKVKVVADIEGLTPNQKHGFHLHENGDCSSADGASAGGHYNPASQPHALPPGTPRHAGDFGNLDADANGKAHLEFTTDTISLAGARNPAIGRAIIVHQKADTGAQPTGDAGGRLGCGVVGVASAATQ
jgi:Cu-Zn family superoxide dismutase